MMRPIRLLRALAIAAFLLAALAPGGAVAKTHVRRLKNVWSAQLPERMHSDSVAIGPAGTAWFGVETPYGAALGQAASHRLTEAAPGGGALSRNGAETYGSADSVAFDSAGNLWFALDSEAHQALVRRTPEGALTEFPLPAGAGVSSLAISSDGGVWFTRGTYSSGSDAAVGMLTPSGTVTQFALGSTGRPASIVVGPDGAAWFTQPEAGLIDRVTSNGQVQSFAVGTGVEPRQLAAGPDGALWFSENGRPRPHKPDADRIGRITTAGGVAQFPITFGEGTQALAVAPSGRIWFTTETGEFASIGVAGKVARGACTGLCGGGYTSIAFAPSGPLWFTAAGTDCSGCGGSASLEAENEGTVVGEIPARSLKPSPLAR